MQAEGVTFHYRRPCRRRLTVDDLQASTTPSLLAGGAEKPRDLPIPGRELDGVHFAMDFLPQQNRRVSDEPLGQRQPILAAGKHVVVIGGGDTGSDCIGTSNRQGALSVTQLEIMPMPPEQGEQVADLAELADEDAHLVLAGRRRRPRLRRRHGEVRRRERQGQGARTAPAPTSKFQPIPGTEFVLKADLVLLAMGFLGPVQDGMVERTRASSSTSAATSSPTRSSYKTIQGKIFSCGDMRRGQSLVVWAIREGRQCRPRRSTST